MERVSRLGQILQLGLSAGMLGFDKEVLLEQHDESIAIRKDKRLSTSHGFCVQLLDTVGSNLGLQVPS